MREYTLGMLYGKALIALQSYFELSSTLFNHLVIHAFNQGLPFQQRVKSRMNIDCKFPLVYRCTIFVLVDVPLMICHWNLRNQSDNERS